MADIALTATQIAPVFLEKAEIIDMIAAEKITKGQTVYTTSVGKAGLADADAAGKEQFRGIALNPAEVGRPVSVLKRGAMYGFTISGLTPDAVLYLSNTAGALADAAGGKSVICGRVMVLTDKAATKVLYIEADWLRAW
jgi:hypothetical protein